MNISSNVLNVRLLSVDDYAHTANNHPVNIREIGKRVRLRRVELGITQAELADKAKVGLGTVQALEDAPKRKQPRQTSPQNLEKIAKALSVSVENLIAGKDSIAPADPLLVGLNREDLQIARAYHDASTDIRRRAAAVLQQRETAALPADLKDRAAELAARVANYGPAAFEQLEQLATYLRPPDVQRAKEQ